MCYSSAGKCCVIILVSTLMIIGLVCFICGLLPARKVMPVKGKSVPIKGVKKIHTLLIVAGLLALLVCVLAVAGTILLVFLTESRCLFYWLALMVVLAIIIDIVLIVEVEKTKNSYVYSLWDKLPLYGTNIDITKLIDEVQKKYACCGRDGPEDYTNMHQPIPDSCCVPSQQLPDLQNATDPPSPMRSNHDQELLHLHQPMRVEHLRVRDVNPLSPPSIRSDDEEEEILDLHQPMRVEHLHVRDVNPLSPPPMRSGNEEEQLLDLHQPMRVEHLRVLDVNPPTPPPVHTDDEEEELLELQQPMSGKDLRMLDVNNTLKVKIKLAYDLPPKNYTENNPGGMPPGGGKQSNESFCPGCSGKMLETIWTILMSFYILIAAKMLLELAVGVTPCWVLFVHLSKDDSSEECFVETTAVRSHDCLACR